MNTVERSESQATAKTARADGRSVSWRPAAVVCSIFALYLCVAILLQWSSGAFRSQFGAYPDEPAHYVTGLMVHDYFRTPFQAHPVSYAILYYLHLPMVAIGHWPPVFYFIEAAWMSIAGTGRPSVLLLMAILTALVSLTLYMTTRRALGWAAVLTGAIFMAVPAVRWSMNLVMVDICGALFVLWAALALARFIDTERPGYAIAFGVLASLALLTKPAAICLAAVAPGAIVLSGRYRLLRTRALWFSASIVLILCAPWYAMTRTLVTYGVSDAGAIQELMPSLRAMAILLLTQVGPLLVLFIAGARLRQRLAQTEGVVSVLLALVPAALLLVLLGGAGVEPRYLIPAIAPMIVIAVLAAQSLATLIPGRAVLRSPVTAVAITAMLVVAFGSPATQPPAYVNRGVQQLVTRISQESNHSRAIIFLAGSSGADDGAFIAEFAEESPTRPTPQIVVRAEKIMADVNWNGSQYRLRYDRPGDVITVLDRYGVNLVVLHYSREEWPHCQLIRRTAESYPTRLYPIAQFPGSSADAGYQLFRFVPQKGGGEWTELIQNLRRKVAGRYITLLDEDSVLSAGSRKK